MSVYAYLHVQMSNATYLPLSSQAYAADDPQHKRTASPVSQTCLFYLELYS
jgi:hypothetical protein